MAVQVAVEHDLAIVHNFFDHFARVPYAGKGLLEHRLVVSIEIASGQRASIVANNNAVRIEHRHYLEYEVVAQRLSRYPPRIATESYRKKNMLLVVCLISICY